MIFDATEMPSHIGLEKRDYGRRATPDSRH
jgi:hypothetical protein